MRQDRAAVREDKGVFTYCKFEKRAEQNAPSFSSLEKRSFHHLLRMYIKDSFYFTSVFH